MAESILEAAGVEFSYPDGTKALEGVTMSIEKGRKVAILGPNGAGKSSLFLHFNGILRPNRGEVRFHGQAIRYDRKSLLTLRQKIGIVFQDPDTQLFSASVLQEISFGPLNMGLSRDKVVERVKRAMIDTGVSDLADRPTHFLSYGQKKRVSIADILAMEPEVMICDEPTAWLDPAYATQIMELLDDINHKGTTVVISTHDVNLAYSWADYVYVMYGGKVIGAGIPEEVFERDDLLTLAGLDRPWILDIYRVLINSGYLSGEVPLPRNKAELVESISAQARAAGLVTSERKKRQISIRG